MLLFYKIVVGYKNWINENGVAQKILEADTTKKQGQIMNKGLLFIMKGRMYYV